MGKGREELDEGNDLVNQPMENPASMLKRDGDGPSMGDRRPLKFAYASGSQPLEGYTIKRGIGVGGFGDVYYATSDAGKEVALKRIQRNLDVELRGVKQCLNLKHANLVALFDIRYDAQDQAWVVMEYVSGESLGEVIERNPNGMPVDEIQKWFRGIADGVGYLHDHGIVHRDLKPGNIFIDQTTVKIGDYGLSKFISCSRRSGQTESVGTFHYMAPEIGLGKYGKEIDVYALGVLLHEMLTGRVPFEGESSQEIIMKHLTAEPNLQCLEPQQRKIVGKALSKDPAKRFQSVKQMCVELERGLGQVAASGDGVRTPLQDQPCIVAEHAADDPAADRASESSFPEEPIGKFVRGRLQGWKQKLQEFESNSPLFILGVVGVVLLLVLSGVVPLLFALAVAYCVYYLFWFLMVSLTGGKQKPTSPLMDQSVDQACQSPNRPVTSPQRRRRRRVITKQLVEERYRDRLRQKSLLVRASELSGSMLMAVVVCVVLSLLMMVIGSRNIDASFYRWGPLYVWQCLTSIVGAWSILFLAKFWESGNGDHALRRFSMLSVGLFVGLFAAGLAGFLILEPHYLGSWEGLRDAIGAEFPSLYDATGSPRLLAYLGYFGILFLMLRWWVNADPLRGSRLSVFAIFFTMVAALLLYAVLPIPRGCMVAATIVVAVQFSAPWLNNRQRKQLHEELVNSSVT